MNPPSQESAVAVSRDELGEFINVFTHEVRNRLNVVVLEASDLAEQLEGAVDISRLQDRVRDCSEFLKLVRDLLVPENPAAEPPSLVAITTRLRSGALDK